MNKIVKIGFSIECGVVILYLIKLLILVLHIEGILGYILDIVMGIIIVAAIYWLKYLSPKIKRIYHPIDAVNVVKEIRDDINKFIRR